MLPVGKFISVSYLLNEHFFKNGRKWVVKYALIVLSASHLSCE